MKPDIFGKYIHEKTGSHYLELKPDGNYFLFEGSAGVTGTYEVNGTEITIFGEDSTSRAKIQNGVITDEEGDKWVRAKSIEPGTGGRSKCPNCKSDLLETAKFCSNCGTVVNASGTGERSSDDPLASITWLPAILKRDLPWELFEAGGWVLVLIVVYIFVK